MTTATKKTMGKKQGKTIKTRVCYRKFEVDTRTIDKEKRTVQLSFSSETPADRWFGKEILDHNRGSVRLERLRTGAPLLLNHDANKQIGVIEEARIKEKRGEATVRFGKSALASEIFDDVADGIRGGVSVGYAIHRMVRDEVDGDDETFRALDWEPLEISIAPVPLDTTIGVGRNLDKLEFETRMEEKHMDPIESTETPVLTPAKIPEPKVNLEEVREQARKSETERICEISAYAERFPELQKDKEEAISKGWSIDKFRKHALDQLKSGRPVISGNHEDPKMDRKLGMDNKEVKRYSFQRAILAMCMQDPKLAEFEYECSRAVADKTKRTPEGLWVPEDVLLEDYGRRDLTVGTATAGGHTVETSVLGDRFIDFLTNRLLVRQFGATVLEGLTSSIAIPRETGEPTSGWVAEAGSLGESESAFDQVAMSPNTLGAFTEFSRKLLVQSSIGIEEFVRGRLIAACARQVDLTVLHGSGSGAEPEGLESLSGVGQIAIGTNGGAPTWAHIVGLETEVSQDNADVGALGYITNSKVRGKLKQTEKASSTAQFVWMDEPADRPFGSMNGYRAGVSNQVKSNLIKGSLTTASAIFFGDWSSAILGFWGGLDIIVNPFSKDTTGVWRITVHKEADINFMHPESFARIVDADTT